MLRSKRARVSAVLASGVVASSLGFVALAGGTATQAIGASAAIWGTCTGQKQGPIKSDVTTKAFAGQWAIAHITDGLNSPYDAASGLSSGRRQEQGIKISMAANPATVRLLGAQTANENLTSCTFDFYRPTATGALQKYFQIKLTNASVVNYALNGSPTSGTVSEFTFVAQRIQRTWVPSGTISIDTWNQVA
jgi:type VI secretion system secreted protein Hcp